MESSQILKIALYGKTGAGKSFLGNVIVKHPAFKVGHDLKSCTLGSSSIQIDWPGIGKV